MLLILTKVLYLDVDHNQMIESLLGPKIYFGPKNWIRLCLKIYFGSKNWIQGLGISDALRDCVLKQVHSLHVFHSQSFRTLLLILTNIISLDIDNVQMIKPFLSLKIFLVPKTGFRSPKISDLLEGYVLKLVQNFTVSLRETYYTRTTEDRLVLYMIQETAYSQGKYGNLDIHRIKVIKINSGSKNPVRSIADTLQARPDVF